MLGWREPSWIHAPVPHLAQVLPWGRASQAPRGTSSSASAQPASDGSAQVIELSAAAKAALLGWTLGAGHSLGVRGLGLAMAAVVAVALHLVRPWRGQLLCTSCALQEMALVSRRATGVGKSDVCQRDPVEWLPVRAQRGLGGTLAGTGQLASRPLHGLFPLPVWLSPRTHRKGDGTPSSSQGVHVFFIAESLTSVFYKPSSIKSRLPIIAFFKRAIMWGGPCRCPLFGNDPRGRPPPTEDVAGGGGTCWVPLHLRLCAPGAQQMPAPPSRSAGAHSVHLVMEICIRRVFYDKAHFFHPLKDPSGGGWESPLGPAQSRHGCCPSRLISGNRSPEGLGTCLLSLTWWDKARGSGCQPAPRGGGSWALLCGF